MTATLERNAPAKALASAPTPVHPAQLALKGILPKEKPAKAPKPKTSKPAAKTNPKKTRRPSAIDQIREVLELADKAAAQGMSLGVRLDDYNVSGIIRTFRTAVAKLWLPKDFEKTPYGRYISDDVIKALGDSLPERRFDPQDPHRFAKVCKVAHKETLPDRFTIQWLEARAAALEEAKHCPGIAQQFKERHKEAAKIAAAIRADGGNVDVDEYGDLHIDRGYNPFSNVLVGEPFPDDCSFEVLSIEVGGYTPNDIEFFSPFARNDTSGFGFDGYPDHQRKDCRFEEIDRNDFLDRQRDLSLTLYCCNGVFAIVKARDYPKEVGKLTQLATIHYQEQYRDADGKVHTVIDAYKNRRRNEWVTFLGEPPKKDSRKKAKSGRVKAKRRRTTKPAVSSKAPASE